MRGQQRSYKVIMEGVCLADVWLLEVVGAGAWGSSVISLLDTTPTAVAGTALTGAATVDDDCCASTQLHCWSSKLLLNAFSCNRATKLPSDQWSVSQSVNQPATDQSYLESLAGGLLVVLTSGLLDGYVAAGQVVDTAVLLVILEQAQDVGDLGLVVLLLLLEQEQLLLLLVLLMELLLLHEQLLLLLQDELLLLKLRLLAGVAGQLALVGVDGRVQVEVLGRVGLLADVADGLERGPHERVELEALLVEFDGLRHAVRFAAKQHRRLNFFNRCSNDQTSV